jgi:hypothetical protein
MPLTSFPPGLFTDRPPVSGSPFYRWGYNIRFRMGLLETIGLHGKVLDVAGSQLVLPGGVIRKLYVTPSSERGQILAGSYDTVTAIEYDDNSTPGTGTRWKTADVTPAALAPTNDVVTDPAAGRIEIPPVWWFADQDDLVVGSRANVTGEPAYAWDRGFTSTFVPLANSPTGAVAGGIIGRILVLLGCTSFTDPDPNRFMVIRWSDRYNFETWTPSDINLSGELLLEGGSRIIGGGVVGKGVIAWTDKRMALLTETGDPDSVFARRYIDGGRGLLCNNGWCEADGLIWWMDEQRVLNVWDGGRPTQVINPLRLATVERVDDAQLSRAYMVPNPEFGEVIFWYPDPDDPAGLLWTGLVYSYADQAWSIWRFDRTAWGPRVGLIRNIAADSSNRLWFHDVDNTLPDDYLPLLFPQPVLRAASIVAPEPYDWAVETGLLTSGEPTVASVMLTRQLNDNLPSGMVGFGDDDLFRVRLRAFGEPTLKSPRIYEDYQDLGRGDVLKDYRVQGKALQVVIEGTAQQTVWRFGQSDAAMRAGGQR